VTVEVETYAAAPPAEYTNTNNRMHTANHQEYMQNRANRTHSMQHQVNKLIVHLMNYCWNWFFKDPF